MRYMYLLTARKQKNSLTRVKKEKFERERDIVEAT
jgi:hypothetical protein